ncbi:MAG: hypothetical protein HC924_19080 [Synechococcaceae cyanobacterium SM2_3_2]|nr:hypothetical protein [Synechococcaceae cyanobacterium SM2_3_2]
MSEELELLALGYNWCGRHEDSFKVAKLNLSQSAHNLKLFRSIRIYALSAFGHDLPRFITACDECITEGIQPIAFWHLLKADHYIDCAKGNWDLKSYRYWSEGEPMVYPELLGCAVESIRAVLAAQPGLREDESIRGWVGEWNLRFVDVLEMMDPEEFGGQSSPSVPVKVPEA